MNLLISLVSPPEIFYKTMQQKMLCLWILSISQDIHCFASIRIGKIAHLQYNMLKSEIVNRLHPPIKLHTICGVRFSSGQFPNFCIVPISGKYYSDSVAIIPIMGYTIA